MYIYRIEYIKKMYLDTHDRENALCLTFIRTTIFLPPKDPSGRDTRSPIMAITPMRAPVRSWRLSANARDLQASNEKKIAQRSFLASNSDARSSWSERHQTTWCVPSPKKSHKYTQARRGKVTSSIIPYTPDIFDLIWYLLLWCFMLVRPQGLLRFYSSISSLLLHTSFGFLPPPPPTTTTTTTTSSFRSGFSFATISAISMTTSAAPIDSPFGSWESPITSKAITAGSVKLGGGLFVCPAVSSSSSKNGEVMLWLEGRPQEGGRNVLCQYKADNDGRRIDISPTDANVRTRVHEYGGGSVILGDSLEQIFVVDFATQQLCQLETGTSATTSQLKPIPTSGDYNPSQYRFADGVYQDGTIYCVREDHGPEGKAAPSEVQNTIVAVDTLTGKMTVLASGNDFYAAPRISSKGDELAYVTWNHPNMPWDATELRVATLKKDDEGAGVVILQSDEKIAGGVDGDDSIMQPLWHPNGDYLFYISDESGYYNLYRAARRRNSTEQEEPKCIWKLDHDLGGAAPGWMLGQQGYTFLPQDGRLAAVYQKDGKSVLVLADVVDGDGISNIQGYGTDDGLPMMFGSITPASQSTELYFVGGSPSTPTSLYKWNWQQQQQKTPAELLICSSSQTYDERLISVPRQVEFPTTGGRTAFGYYYPPKNHRYICTTDTNGPPLLVKAHGGPTACTGTSFNPNIQFWTSRGFAILDVDYGGSTGYGREYRRRLRGSWGIVDIDDVCNGAQYLVKQGLADGKRLCIDGGSAGGYTTLGALAFRDVFQAGCSLYGVADLTALAGDTHKFESRYLDGLVGKYPQDESIYKERSPIESVEKLSCPILLLQGDEDKIVPPNQAEMMHEALLKKGIPTCLKIYKGEQHGFRKAENIEDALDSELAFYGKVFGIKVPGAVDLKIDNLKQ